MTAWLIGQAGLNALRTASPHLAARFFNRPASYVIGMPPTGWDTQPVAAFTSYATYTTARVSAHHWVLYDPEAWKDKTPPPTPLDEQEHPTAFISAFATLAHARSQQVIAAPSRDLMSIPTADYSTRTNGETADEAFLAAGLPAACASADVYHCQAQALQPDPAAYLALITGAVAQLPGRHPVWAGLTTLRGDPVAAITACYHAASPHVSGFWLNTNADTIGVAVDFLAAVGRP